MNILVINPGSSSTKIAIFKDLDCQFEYNISHDNSQLSKFNNISDQYEFRKSNIIENITKHGYKLSDIDVIAARGGILPPVSSGAYEINQVMVDRLKNNPLLEHASNLAAVIAYALSTELNIKSYIYDSVAVDEFEDVARISGIKEITRSSFSHALNSRAMAHEVATDLNKQYKELNFIVAHLGGGITISAHKLGRMIDIVSDDEGSFSPERAGRVPCKKLIDLCYSEKYTKQEMHKMLRGKGGFISYLNTNDVRKVSEQALDNKETALLLEALPYQVSKSIGEMATVLKGDVDAIVITGGIAHSNYIVDYIRDRVSFISDVHVKPGENEMRALANGIYRVMNNLEQSKEYTE